MNQIFKFQLFQSHCIYCHIGLYVFCQQVFNLYSQQAVQKGFDVFFFFSPCFQESKERDVTRKCKSTKREPDGNRHERLDTIHFTFITLNADNV